jgi:acyl-CoA thioester hydrolase
VVNRWLIERCGLVPQSGSSGGGVIGLVAETRCQFFAPVTYPAVLQLGLAVTHLGRSSVQYQIAVFGPHASTATEAPAPPAAAVGHFVHVYVDAHTRRPVALPDRLRQGLGPLVRPAPSSAHL